MTQLEIQILHQDYLLTCPDGQEAQLMEAVERVDQQFQKMRDTSKLRSRERIGVLLAVNLAYENLELRNQLQALQQQLAHSQSPEDSAQFELDTERLAALEAQAAVDQQAAIALLQRLDAVLGSQETTEASIDASRAHGAALIEETAVAMAQAADAEAPPNATQAVLNESVTTPSTDSEHLQDVSLVTTSAENL